MFGMVMVVTMMTMEATCFSVATKNTKNKADQQLPAHLRILSRDPIDNITDTLNTWLQFLLTSTRQVVYSLITFVYFFL